MASNNALGAFQTNSGVNTAQVNSVFAARMQNLIDAAQAATGSQVQITSGYRSPTTQAQIYANTYGPITYNGVRYTPNGPSSRVAAPPGKSEHQTGTALDVDPNSAAAKWMAQHASQYGIEWGGTWSGNQKDPPHFQLPRSEVQAALAGKLPLPPQQNVPDVASAYADTSVPLPRPRPTALDAINQAAPYSSLPVTIDQTPNAGNFGANAGDALGSAPYQGSMSNALPLAFNSGPLAGQMPQFANEDGSPDDRGTLPNIPPAPQMLNASGSPDDRSSTTDPYLPTLGQPSLANWFYSQNNAAPVTTGGQALGTTSPQTADTPFQPTPADNISQALGSWLSTVGPQSSQPAAVAAGSGTSPFQPGPADNISQALGTWLSTVGPQASTPSAPTVAADSSTSPLHVILQQAAGAYPTDAPSSGIGTTAPVPLAPQLLNTSGSPDDRDNNAQPVYPASVPLPRTDPRFASSDPLVNLVNGGPMPVYIGAGTIPDPTSPANTPYTVNYPPASTMLGGASKLTPPAAVQGVANALGGISSWLGNTSSTTPSVPLPQPRPTGGAYNGVDAAASSGSTSWADPYYGSSAATGGPYNSIDALATQPAGDNSWQQLLNSLVSAPSGSSSVTMNDQSYTAPSYTTKTITTPGATTQVLNPAYTAWLNDQNSAIYGVQGVDSPSLDANGNVTLPGSYLGASSSKTPAPPKYTTKTAPATTQTIRVPVKAAALGVAAAPRYVTPPVAMPMTKVQQLQALGASPSQAYNALAAQTLASQQGTQGQTMAAIRGTSGQAVRPSNSSTPMSAI